MTELRRHPQLGTWVMVSAQRQNRPQMPKNWCPFCPGSGQVPEQFDVFLYTNDFPHLMPDPPEPTQPGDDLYKTGKVYGHCDVVLYSPDHQGSIKKLSPEHRMKLFSLWRRRTEEVSQEEFVKYCFVFENKGDVIGVTMPHPHGQIYSYPFVPLRIQTELNTALQHFQVTGRNLYDDIIAHETASQVRVIHETENYLLVTPFAGDFPYETHLYTKPHRLHLMDLSYEEADEFMNHLQSIVRMYDTLFGFELPFVMAFHQAPVDGADYPYYRFHVEFYPMHRAADRLKYNAGSEMGAWAFTNPAAPEEKAAELRDLMNRILKEG